jgi:hypothetical protein
MSFDQKILSNHFKFLIMANTSNDRSKDQGQQKGGSQQAEKQNTSGKGKNEENQKGNTDSGNKGSEKGKESGRGNQGRS